MKVIPAKWVLKIKRGGRRVTPLKATRFEPQGIVIVYDSSGNMRGIVNPFTRNFIALRLEVN